MVVVATPAARVVAGRAVPSTTNVTVPEGGVVPDLGVTVALRVTVAPTTGLVGVAVSAVVVERVKA